MTDRIEEPLLTEREVAALTKTSPKMWQNRRCAGDGPAFLKIGRAVRYRRSEVEAWIAAQSASKAA